MRVSFYTAGVLAVLFARQLNAVSVRFNEDYQDFDFNPIVEMSAAQTNADLETEASFGFKKSFNKLKKFGTKHLNKGINTVSSWFNKKKAAGVRNLK